MEQSFMKKGHTVSEEIFHECSTFYPWAVLPNQLTSAWDAPRASAAQSCMALRYAGPSRTLFTAVTTV